MSRVVGFGGADVYRGAPVVDLDYDMLSHMVPINVTGPLYCCPEANHPAWTHPGDAVGAA